VTANRVTKASAAKSSKYLHEWVDSSAGIMRIRLASPGATEFLLRVAPMRVQAPPPKPTRLKVVGTASSFGSSRRSSLVLEEQGPKRIMIIRRLRDLAKEVLRDTFFGTADRERQIVVVQLSSFSLAKLATRLRSFIFGK
jgi:hypothetical protein